MGVDTRFEGKKMAFTEEEINDFRVEAEELLDSAEQALLALDKGADFKAHYDAIFRAFHSIKGAAGMMEMFDVQAHMHQLENTLTEQKSKPVLAKSYIDLFLRGSDGARSLLNQRSIEFDYSVKEESGAESAAAPEKSVQEVKKAVLVELRDVPAAPLIPAPVALGASAPKAADIPPVQSSGESRVEPRGKILVIDDEPELVTIISRILRNARFEVMGSSSSVEALELVESFSPDTIVTDLMMPIVSGMDILQAMRAKHPDIPVVFVSGYVSKEFLLEAIESGVFGIIEKPFDSGKIFEVCNNSVKKCRTSRLLNRSLNLIMYQFHDLDEYLKNQGKDDIRKIINTELDVIIRGRRLLREIERKAG